MMPQTERDAQISRRFVSESLSSLDYKAFNETRTRFVVEKIHSSLLYNHLNRKKMSTLIATERSLCFSWHLHWKPSKDTTHGGAQRTGCSVNSSFFSSRTIADRCRQSLSSVWWRSLPKLWGGGREEAVLGIWAPRPEWTLDRLFWPSPGYQNKRTLKTHKPPHGIKCGVFKRQILWNEPVCLIKD